MATVKKELELINNNSIKIYYLLETRKLKLEDLYKLVFEENNEIVLSKILHSKKNLDEYNTVLTKRDCLEEVLYISDKKYQHLKGIKDLVNIDHLISTVITNEIYNNKINIYYTNKIIDKLVDTYYDYKSIKILSKYKKEALLLNNLENIKIMQNIDRYYIEKITI